jgi:hypothetical protein
MESDGAAAVGGGVALYTYNTNRSVETALNTSMVWYKLIYLLHTHSSHTHTHSCVVATAACTFFSGRFSSSLLCPFASPQPHSTYAHTQEADRSVADLLSTDVRSNVDFSLDVVFTTLPIELEQACRSAVIITLSKARHTHKSRRRPTPHLHHNISNMIEANVGIAR